ncbi:MAG TPA: ABC transporter permease [Gemmatimonadaceae bacterium]|jgi:predicted permease|nr:ABC transporter permease [Gemmatimonadaceae bacterium]
MNRLSQEIKFAWRSLLKNPGFSVIVAACIAIGIAVNTTIFSVTDAIVLRPFDFEDSERLVTLKTRGQRGGDNDGSVSYLDFEDWKTQSRSFEGMAAFGYRNLSITDGEEPERLEGNIITWDLFQLLGKRPQIGRLFMAEDDRPGAPGVVILSDEVWRRRYHGDSSILGTVIQVNALPHTVVGVMPPRFKFPQEAQLWIPVAGLAQNDQRNWYNFDVFARLKPNVKVEQANNEIDALSQQLNKQYGVRDGRIGLAKPIREDLIPDDVTLVVLAMMGAVTLVLLVACANVANLMLARGSARAREIAIRTAIGAGRGAIVRQLLVESLLLALIGAVIAIPLAQLGLNLLDAAMPAEDPIPYYIDWRLDYRTLIYTFGLALVTGVIFGLTPALQSTSGKMYGALKEGGRGSGSGVKKNRLRATLVVAEVALSVVLLVGASLFVRSFLGMRNANVGFATDPLLTMRFYLPGSMYDSTSAKVQRVEDVLRRVEALPGVQAAAVSNLIPIDGGGNYSPIEIEGAKYGDTQRPLAFWAGVTGHWLSTLGVPLLAGRNMTESEALDSMPVAVVTQDFARRFFASSDPLGRRFRIASDSAAPHFTIIGVIADFRYSSLDDTDRPVGAAYVPYPYMFARNNGLVVRAAANPIGLTNSLREQIRASDSKVPVFDVMNMNDVKRLSFWQYQLFGWMFGIFGVIALALAAIGVYGVISFGVTQRTQEIGVRIALGAQRRDVLRMIVMNGLTLAGIGIAVGALAAFGVTRVVRSLLIGVSPTDPISFGWVALFLAMVVAVASYFPARRAMAVDPIIALRTE